MVEVIELEESVTLLNLSGGGGRATFSDYYEEEDADCAY